MKLLASWSACLPRSPRPRPDVADPRAALKNLVAVFARARVELGEMDAVEVSAALRELAHQIAGTQRRARAGRGGIRGRRHGKTSQGELVATWLLARDQDPAARKAGASREIAAMKGEPVKYVDERLHRGLRRLPELVASPELADRPHLRALLAAWADPTWCTYGERNRTGGRPAKTLELIKAAWKTPKTPEALPPDHPAWSRIGFPDWLTARDYAAILRAVAAEMAPAHRTGGRARRQPSAPFPTEIRRRNRLHSRPWIGV